MKKKKKKKIKGLTGSVIASFNRVQRFRSVSFISHLILPQREMLPTVQRLNNAHLLGGANVKRHCNVKRNIAR